MKQFQSILFADIETVPKVKHFADLGERGQEVFKAKFKTKISEASKDFASEFQVDHLHETLWQDNAALHAEFNQIVSIGLGYFLGEELRIAVKVTKDEAALLDWAKGVIGNAKYTKICGHNFNGFDGPIMSRKMVMAGIPTPYILNPMGKKTWDLAWIDTMVLWAMGEYNAKCSLDRMCYALNVDTPKGEISGAQVKDYFYGAVPAKEDLPFGIFDKEEARFDVIRKYQQGDIVALANCFLRLHNEPIVPQGRIVMV